MTRDRERLGAFCTDIEGATQRTADLEEMAFEQHRIYLEEAGRYFISSLPDHERRKYRSSDFWVPGDALWAVFYPEGSNSKSESITLPMWRLIAAVVHGLHMANSADPGRLSRLSVRGVILAGVTPIHRVRIFEKLTLSSGTTLNACGRLEKTASPNTIIVGFVMPKGDVSDRPLFESRVRCPLVPLDDVLSVLQRRQDMPLQGYRIGLDVVSHDNRELLHFTGWPKREDLRGLAKYDVVTTSIRLNLTNDKSLLLDRNRKGIWDRREVTIPLKEQVTSRWGLYDLLDHSKSPAFGYLKDIYQESDVRFEVNERVCELKFSGEGARPRVSRDHKVVSQVSFDRESFCILPTDHNRASGGAATLIQASYRKGSRVLCFSKVPPADLNRYHDYSDYVDSSAPCVEFTFS